MRIGVEMRLVTLGGAGGIAMLLRGVLRALFERQPQHQFVCFNTVFNRGLLGEVPGNVELCTLPLGSYFQDVGRLCAEKQVDVLFRGYPLEQPVDFPLRRQVVEIPDIQHEYFPEFFDAECLRSRRAAFSGRGPVTAARREIPTSRSPGEGPLAGVGTRRAATARSDGGHNTDRDEATHQGANGSAAS